MKALVCERFGPLKDLRIKDIPVPVPGPDQVVVQVKAASLNFPDVLICRGEYQVKPTLPFSPGAEMAGIVCAVGENVVDFRPGDRVMASTGYGALAQYCLADAWRLIPIPNDLSFEYAATLIVTYGTALHALQSCGRLRVGETLLVLGAAGGVGSAALQIARLLGAKVIAAVSSAEKAFFCGRLGAQKVICYEQMSTLKAQVMALTEGRGVDMVFDPVGGDYAQQALRSLAWRGRYLVIGFAAGSISSLPLNLALLQERQIFGVYWGEAIKRDPVAYRATLQQLCQWAVDGQINPAISQQISLDAAVAALHKLAQRQLVGKVVVTFTDRG